MAFQIPNEASAFHTHQAQPDAVDFDILSAGIARNGVHSGCAVTAQGSPDMTVAVAAGKIILANGPITVTSGNVTIGTANASNPRFDLITVNNVGTKACTAGTAAANPVFPAIPANSVVLAAVYIPANDTTIASNQIIDKRAIIVDNPIWSTFTAGLGAATTNPNRTTGLSDGAYYRVGNTIFAEVFLSWGTSSTAGSGIYFFTVLGGPAARYQAGAPIGVARMRDNSTGLIRMATVRANFTFEQYDTTVSVSSTSPWTWADGDSLSATIRYEVD